MVCVLERIDNNVINYAHCNNNNTTLHTTGIVTDNNIHIHYSLTNKVNYYVIKLLNYPCKHCLIVVLFVSITIVVVSITIIVVIIIVVASRL
jgi:hypothetical protein